MATADDAVRIAAQLLGRRGRATELPSDRDQNFRIDTADGSWVLKIANAGERAETLALQTAALERLAERASGLAPKPAGRSAVATELVSGRHLARMVEWMDGAPWAAVCPHSPELIRDLGRVLGRVDAALRGLPAPSAQQPFAWDLLCAGDVLSRSLPELPEPQRGFVAEILRRYGALQPSLASLPRQWIHNDVNDHNILVARDGLELRVGGLIDLGDMRFSVRVGELAIALAYLVLGRRDPLVAVEALVRGYTEASPEAPCSEAELDALWTLTLTRLAVSLSMAAEQRALEPDNAYLSVTERPALEALPALLRLHPHLVRAVARTGAGLEPCPTSAAVQAWLRGANAAPVLEGYAPHAFTHLDPAVESMGPEARPDARFGRWGEARSVYANEGFATAAGEQRTVHLGVDLFAPQATGVCAPIEGVVEAVADNARPLDYGPTVILRHEPEAGVRFWTLYGHLGREVLAHLAPGDRVAAGERFASLGGAHENGGWAPHVHLQVITDLMGWVGDFPGVAAPSEEHLWRSFLPDPSALVGFDAADPIGKPADGPGLRARRAARLAPSLSLSYARPLHIVQGRGAYLVDERGRRFLDLVNNVCHVGHCHPDVVRAGAAQMARLNTNTRYLHETILRCAEKLVARCPAPLEVVFFTNSGSEANDLALRLAQAHTGARGVVCLDGAYHGNLQRLVDISPYKHAGPGGRGPGEAVRVAAIPDTYRGEHRGADAGARYAASVAACFDALCADAAGGAAFIHESILSCGGQVPLPTGYLAAAYGAVRAAGGVCIADEVQVGFGRVGAGFWAFEEHGVVPDILTMGKPMGNGHPVAGVVTTRAIAESFHNGMEYFNTFGGNPVSCAIAEAVLDAIEREGLVARAAELGGVFFDGLRDLMERHPLVGEVRGRGLFLGMELVRDRQTLEPAAEEASYIVERMRDAGFLLSTDGPLHNVIKIKPPLAISREDVARTLQNLDRVFAHSVLARPRN